MSSLTMYCYSSTVVHVLWYLLSMTKKVKNFLKFRSEILKFRDKVLTILGIEPGLMAWGAK